LTRNNHKLHCTFRSPFTSAKKPPQATVLILQKIFKATEFLNSKAIKINKYNQTCGDQKTISKKRILLVIFSIIAISILITVLLLPATHKNVDPAVTKAINYLEKTENSIPPYGLLFLNIIYRRFGIQEFANTLQLYDQTLTKDPDQTPILRVFRRIADYNNQLQPGDLDAVTEDIDQVTVPALYCDRLGLPSDYHTLLEGAMNVGSYMIPHVLLAVIWMQENGCEVPMPDGFVENLYHANAALIKDDSVVDDLKLEAAAFLYIAGQGSLVGNAFIDRVLAVQNDDGGWFASSDTPDESYWHATILALMLLLHVEHQAGSYPPMLATASP
jgi:hypothetical protein